MPELRNNAALVAVLLSACETKNPRIILTVTSCLQKLISQNAIAFSAESISSIYSMFFISIMTMNMDVQLKVLQSVLPLLLSMPELHGKTLAMVWLL